MTGSGKTGLCIALLEEAAIDGVPAIVIDPKGDLANLMLTFPELRGADFLPWVNEEEARRKGVEPAAYAEAQAALWKKGLAEWGQDGERIRRLREAAEFAIYTPGSSAGIPLSILKSFQAPEKVVLEDGDLRRERVATTATSLLALVGVDADPVQSREHILLSTILDTAWRQGQDLDLAGVIQQIQNPPVQRVGVFDLESFFPSKERFGLAMTLNNLLASPGFSAWLEGEPLDIGRLLWTPAGKPRVAIVSIAHLSDAERMFFVSLLLTQVLGWMRTQSGTTSLRALLYMDEIFGFFPPVANPPSKQPLLTLLKQARAYGLGVVLATQNPVDLDYKGLGNTGTWLLGRLQTERDKQRVLEGLEGAAGGARFDRAAMERTLAGLGNRVFLMHNVHEDAPVVFESRWAMSYLRGPLTRVQIKQLMDGAAGGGRRRAAAAAGSGGRAPAAGGAGAPRRPATPRARAPCCRRTSRSSSCGRARPATTWCTSRRSSRSARSTTPTRRRGSPPTRRSRCSPTRRRGWTGTAPKPRRCATRISSGCRPRTTPSSGWCRPRPRRGAATWSGARRTPSGCTARAGSSCSRAPPPAWSRSPARRSATSASGCRPPPARSATRSSRRSAGATPRASRASRSASAPPRPPSSARSPSRRSSRCRRRSPSARRSSAPSSAARPSAPSSLGRATTAVRGAGRTMKEREDVGRAAGNVQELAAQRDELQRAMDDEIARVQAAVDPLTEQLESVAIAPKKKDVAVSMTALAWVPYRRDGRGGIAPA